MKKIVLLIGIVTFFADVSFAQEDKTVTLTVSGQGQTQDEAKQNALRNAIEQAFGTFISSNTEILNDELVKDEIVSVANGNIQKFDVISEVQIPNGGYATTLKATVSIGKLTTFIESKGGEADIKGGEFSYNVKKEEFYNTSELKAIRDFLKIRIHSEIFYDYSLFILPPKVEGENYSIELEIGIKANNNIFNFFSDFFTLLKNISLDSETINFRKQSNLPVYSIEIKDGETYNLRNQESFKLVQNLERFLFLKAGDFIIISDPQFDMPDAFLLIKSNVVANNFIIFNRTKSPNPGVYWSWLPYEYSMGESELNDQWTSGNNNLITLTTEYLKVIPKQSDLNRYSGHMGSVVNNGRTDYSIVLKKKILFTRIDFERLNSIKIEPKLNNYD